eukprot:scaffold10697_cov151-Amphora_coffeaeformis.AAC.4
MIRSSVVSHQSHESFYVPVSINRPGGAGKITKVEMQDDQVKLTVKYILGGSDKDLDPCLVEVPEELGTRERKRREVLTVPVEETKKRSVAKKRPSQEAISDSKENAQNPKVTPPAATEILKAANIKRGRRKSFKKRKTEKKDDRSKWPADLPVSIVIRRTELTSPMNEKGAEDGRNDIRITGSMRRPPRSSPSTLFARSPREATVPMNSGGEEDDYAFSDSNSEPSSLEEKSDASMKVEEEDAKQSAVDLSMADAPVKRVTMQSLVDREMKEAANFVDDVLKSKPGEDPKKEEKKKEAVPKTSPRQEELMAVFLRLMDHNEGTVEEECLAAQINQQSAGNKDFGDHEVNDLMESLATNNKIMRCDGNIYWL